MRLMVVEDDAAIAEPLVAGLERAGFDVVHAPTGADAIGAERVDLVLLDLGLPDLDGSEVCRRLRSNSDVPIIVVSARGEELDRVLMLEMGADDYVVKPFGLRELIARIRAVARRTGSEGIRATEPEVLRTGDVEIDVRSRRVVAGGEDVALTPKEFDLLAHLAREPERVFTRQEILEAVWDAHWYGPTKTLDVHVASLRKKLGRPDVIGTVRGVGFRAAAPTSGGSGGPAA